MAKILGKFLAFYTINRHPRERRIDNSTISEPWLTLGEDRSKIIETLTKGGVTMESGTSGSIPGRSSKRAVVRP